LIIELIYLQCLAYILEAGFFYIRDPYRQGSVSAGIHTKEKKEEKKKEEKKRERGEERESPEHIQR